MGYRESDAQGAASIPLHTMSAPRIPDAGKSFKNAHSPLVADAQWQLRLQTIKARSPGGQETLYTRDFEDDRISMT